MLNRNQARRNIATLNILYAQTSQFYHGSLSDGKAPMAGLAVAPEGAAVQLPGKPIQNLPEDSASAVYEMTPTGDFVLVGQDGSADS